MLRIIWPIKSAIKDFSHIAHNSFHVSLVFMQQYSTQKILNKKTTYKQAWILHFEFLLAFFISFRKRIKNVYVTLHFPLQRTYCHKKWGKVANDDDGESMFSILACVVGMLSRFVEMRWIYYLGCVGIWMKLARTVIIFIFVLHNIRTIRNLIVKLVSTNECYNVSCCFKLRCGYFY